MSANKPIAVGLGCDRHTPLATVRQAIDEALTLCQASMNDVQAVASINLKADEPALQQLAEQQGWTIRFYTAQEDVLYNCKRAAHTIEEIVLENQ